MKQKILTILIIWVVSLIGLLVTVESLDYTFFLFFTAFGFTSYALRYDSNTVSYNSNN